MNKEQIKELAVITAYIMQNNLLQAEFINSIDKAYDIALKFAEKYPHNFQWEYREKDWDEVLEEFVKINK